MKKTIFLTSIFLIWLAWPTSAKAQAKDIYGGFLSVPCTSSNPGGWAVVTIQHRKVQCTPLGYAQIGKTIDAVATNLSQGDQFGWDAGHYATIKYGSNWASATIQQIAGWGMNGLYNYAAANITANAAGIPVQLPFVLIPRPCFYNEQLNVTWNDGLTSPIKNVYYASSPYYKAFGYDPADGVCDYDDPGYDIATHWVLTNSGGGSIYAALTSSAKLFVQGITGEETDQAFGYSGGFDFATTPANKNQPHVGMVVATGSPVLTGDGNLYHSCAGGVNGCTNGTQTIYPDHFVHQKVTWMNQLVAKYGTIATLNGAGGWNTSSYYTTFGTSGTCYGVSAHWIPASPAPSATFCAASGAAGTTSGSGSGPYTITLNTVVSKYSVAVYDGSTMICGDDGSGHFVSQTQQTEKCTASSSTVNYATGVVSLTLNTTPGATPTVEYIANGYSAGGTGVMDEDDNNGTSQGWLGTCNSSTNNYPALSCNYDTYGGMNANLVTDAKNFEYQIAVNWLSGQRAIIHTDAPTVEYIPPIQGSWGTVPNCQLSKAAALNGDIFTVVDPVPTQAMLDFVRTCAGVDAPIEVGIYSTADQDGDSSWPNSTTTHSGTTVTITSAAGDPFYLGTGSGTSNISVTGCSDSTYNTSSPVTVAGATNFVASINTTAASRTGTTVTLTMASNPLTAGYHVGLVTVTGFSGPEAVFNGSFNMTSVTSTQIIYATQTSGSITATSNGTAQGFPKAWTTATYTLSPAPSTSSATGCNLYFTGGNTAIDYPTHAAMGAGFISDINTMLAATYTASGTHMFIGYDKWAMYGAMGNGDAYGLLSQYGNAYDGVEDVTGSVACSAPEAAYTCGGELQNYGNLITSVLTANATIDATITALPTTPPPPPPPPFVPPPPTNLTIGVKEGIVLRTQ